MNTSKLDIIILGVLSVLALALVGTYALIHPGAALPSDLVALATLVIGGFAGRAMPALASSSSEVGSVLEAISGALGSSGTSTPTTAQGTAVLATPEPAPADAAVVPTPGSVPLITPNIVPAVE